MHPVMVYSFVTMAPIYQRQPITTHSSTQYTNHRSGADPLKQIGTDRMEQHAAHHCQATSAGSFTTGLLTPGTGV